MNELRIERIFSSDPETVFSYVSKTEHLLKWWGPEGMTVSEHDLDLSRLGPWSSVILGSENNRYKMSGEVIAIDPPNLVEFTWGWHDENDQRGHGSKVRFEVSSNGEGGTRFLLTHSDLPDEEVAKNHNVGWTSALVKLERLAN